MRPSVKDAGCDTDHSHKLNIIFSLDWLANIDISQIGTHQWFSQNFKDGVRRNVV